MQAYLLELTLTVIAAFVLACSRGTSSEPPARSPVVAGQVLMKVRDDARAAEAAQAIGGTLLRASSISGWYLVALDPSVSVDQAVARGQGNPLIEAVEPNYTAAPQPGVEGGPTPFGP